MINNPNTFNDNDDFLSEITTDKQNLENISNNSDIYRQFAYIANFIQNQIKQNCEPIMDSVRELKLQNEKFINQIEELKNLKTEYNTLKKIGYGIISFLVAIVCDFIFQIQPNLIQIPDIKQSIQSVSEKLTEINTNEKVLEQRVYQIEQKLEKGKK